MSFGGTSGLPQVGFEVLGFSGLGLKVLGFSGLGLEILAAEDKQVSFRAYFVQLSNRRLQCLYEASRFLREGDSWFYIDGQHRPELAVLPRRKDPCFCGSGKKLKNCHGDLID